MSARYTELDWAPDETLVCDYHGEREEGAIACAVCEDIVDAGGDCLCWNDPKYVAKNEYCATCVAGGAPRMVKMPGHTVPRRLLRVSSYVR